jgi:hypothetical protein
LWKNKKGFRGSRVPGFKGGTIPEDSAFMDTKWAEEWYHLLGDDAEE